MTVQFVEVNVTLVGFAVTLPDALPMVLNVMGALLAASVMPE